MGKLLVINGADFSNVSLAQVPVAQLEMVLFNKPSDGKFKVNAVPTGRRLEVLHLPDAASDWQVEWIDIRKYVGKNLKIGSTGIDESGTTGYSIVFVNELISDITNKNYNFESYNLPFDKVVSEYQGSTSEQQVTVPSSAVGLYVSFMDIQPPIVQLID